MDSDAKSTFVKLFTLSLHVQIEKVAAPEALCFSALGKSGFEHLTQFPNGGLDPFIKRRFMSTPKLTPNDWFECVAAAKYWSALIALREAQGFEATWKNVGLAHQAFCLELLAETTIKDVDESITIVEHFESDSSLMAHREMGAVMKNLVVRPRAHER